jgi:hypothetical protein
MIAPIMANNYSLARNTLFVKLKFDKRLIASGTLDVAFERDRRQGAGPAFDPPLLSFQCSP